MDPAAIGGWNAHVAVWLLPVYRCVVGELRVRGRWPVLRIVAAGPRLHSGRICRVQAMFALLVAIPDIALVFAILKVTCD